VQADASAFSKGAGEEDIAKALGAMIIFDRRTPEGKASSILDLSRQRNLPLEDIRAIVNTVLPDDAHRILPMIEKLMEQERLLKLPIKQKIDRHNELDLEDLIKEINESDTPILIKDLAKKVIGDLSFEESLEKTKSGLIPVPLFITHFSKQAEPYKKELEGDYRFVLTRLFKEGKGNLPDHHKIFLAHSGKKADLYQKLDQVANSIIRDGVMPERWKMYGGILYRRIRNEVRRSIERKIEQDGKSLEDIEKHFSEERGSSGFLWIAKPMLQPIYEKMKKRVQESLDRKMTKINEKHPKKEQTIREFMKELIKIPKFSRVFEKNPNAATKRYFKKHTNIFVDLLKEMNKERNGPV
jgi:hypothetical protein